MKKRFLISAIYLFLLCLSIIPTSVYAITYYVKFNPNGGSGTMSNQTFETDEEKYLSTNTFTREGYNFIGWNSNTGGTGTWYMPSNKVKNLTSTSGATVDVYAQWINKNQSTIKIGTTEVTKDSGGNYNIDNIKKYTVSVVVNNGTVDTSSKSVEYYTNATFAVTPSTNYGNGTVSCTNSQTGSITNNTLTVTSVSNNTTCTVTYFDIGSTVLFTDGTLIINEKTSDRASNIAEHGAVTNEYAPMLTTGTNEQKYIFSSSTLQPWYNQRASIKKVEIGQNISPASTAYWFSELKKATTINLDNLNMVGVTNASSMFYQTGSDTSVLEFSISNTEALDMSNVENMSNMFYQAGYSATKWSIGNLSAWDTSSVKDMSGMFNEAGYSATNLTSIGTLDIYADNVSSMFNNAKYIKATVNIQTNPLNFNNMLVNAAIVNESSITINYACSVIDIDSIIATKSNNSSIIKTTNLCANDAETVLYNDGTLIINEKPSNRNNNITTHGAVIKTYDSLSNSNNYIFSSSSDQPWYNERKKILKVEIGQLIKPTSTAYWFSEANYLYNGNFTNLNTSEVSTMESMFHYCGYLNASAFSLAGLNTWDTSNVTNMKDMFSFTGYGKDHETPTSWSIGNISNWNTSKVTTMQSMFSNAGEYATNSMAMDLSSWDTSNVTNMSYMFNDFMGLTSSLNLGNLGMWDTSNVTTMQSMFQNTASSIGWDNNAAGADVYIGNLSNWNVSKVTDMTMMFYGFASENKTINFGTFTNWDTSSVTSMSNMFYETNGHWANSSANVLWNFGTINVYVGSLSSFIGNSTNANGVINLHANPTDYSGMFNLTALYGGAKVTVNYGCEYSNVDAMIATKSYDVLGQTYTGNVVKGSSICGNRTVNIIVIGGTTNIASQNVNVGQSASFTITPTDTNSVGTVSCSAGNETTFYKSSGAYSLSVSRITKNTTCTVRFADPDTPLSTVQYSDQTLIINEKPADREKNTKKHGEAVNTYEAMSNSNAYVFTTSNDVLWHSESSNIKYVEIGDSIEPTDIHNWFANLTSLKSASLSNLNTNYINDLSYTFNNTGYNSKDFNISGLEKWDVSKVTDMSYMFSNSGYNALNWNISSLYKWKTNRVVNMSHMFNDAGHESEAFVLKGISNWDVIKVTDMNHMFNDAGYKSSIWKIGTLSEWNTANVSNMSYMFNNTGISSASIIDIGNFGIYATDISMMFNGSIQMKATLMINNNPTSYANTFTSTSTKANSLITVNYGCDITNINSIIATKSNTSNVSKGTQLCTAVPYSIKYNANGGHEFLLGYSSNEKTNRWTYENGVYKSAGSDTTTTNYYNEYGDSKQNISKAGSTIYSREFTLTSTETLSFDWAVSGPVTSDNMTVTKTAYLYYIIYKDGVALDDTGYDNTKISGNETITSESDLTYTSVTKQLNPGNYQISFTYVGVDPLTSTFQETGWGLDAGFVKNISLSSTNFTMENQAYSANESKALRKNSYLRPGYNFLGWSTNPNATKATYKDQQIVKNIGTTSDETINLYAVWERSKAYSIQLIVMNGSVVGSNTREIPYNESFTFKFTPSAGYDLQSYLVSCKYGTNLKKVFPLSSDTVTTVDIGPVIDNDVCTVRLRKISDFEYGSYGGTNVVSANDTSSDQCCAADYSYDSSSGKFTINGTVTAANNLIGPYCIDITNNTVGNSCSYSGNRIYKYSTCVTSTDGTCTTTYNATIYRTKNYN